MLVSEFDIASPEVDEAHHQDEEPHDYVARLAAAKAVQYAAAGTLSLGADTTVCLGREILGKPADAEDAHRMLSLLSDTTHAVHTAVALASTETVQTVVVSTTVTFTRLSE